MKEKQKKEIIYMCENLIELINEEQKKELLISYSELIVHKIKKSEEQGIH